MLLRCAQHGICTIFLHAQSPSHAAVPSHVTRSVATSHVARNRGNPSMFLDFKNGYPRGVGVKEKACKIFGFDEKLRKIVEYLQKYCETLRRIVELAGI